MSIQEILKLDALGQAELTQRGEVSAEELLEASIMRVEALNPVLGAVTSRDDKNARARAVKLKPCKPFYGVPTLVKDLMGVSGLPWTFGSRAYEKKIGDETALLASRMTKGGLNIFGKTTTSEFGLAPIGTTSLHGPCRCPWNLEYDSGGSSGGAAVAVASGMVAIAQGGDGGGSLRIPASVNGLVGFKPSRGLLTHLPNSNADGLLEHGALTKSVRDAAAFLDVAKGYMPGDRWRAKAEENYLLCLDDAPKRLRIGVLEGGVFGAVDHKQTLAALKKTSHIFEALGHDVECANIDICSETFQESILDIFSVGALKCCADLGINPHDDRIYEYFEVWTVDLARRAANANADFAMGAWGRLQPVTTAFEMLLDKYDILYTPSLAIPAIKLDQVFNADHYLKFIDSAPLANVSGLPAISIPVGVSDQGIPIGGQIFGKWLEDATVLKLAAEMEREQPWKKSLDELFDQLTQPLSPSTP